MHCARATARSAGSFAVGARSESWQTASSTASSTSARRTAACSPSMPRPDASAGTSTSTAPSRARRPSPRVASSWAPTTGHVYAFDPKDRPDHLAHGRPCARAVLLEPGNLRRAGLHRLDRRQHLRLRALRRTRPLRTQHLRLCLCVARDRPRHALRGLLRRQPLRAGHRHRQGALDLRRRRQDLPARQRLSTASSTSPRSREAATASTRAAASRSGARRSATTRRSQPRPTPSTSWVRRPSPVCTRSAPDRPLRSAPHRAARCAPSSFAVCIYT